MTPAGVTVSGDRLRTVVGTFPSGVTIVTTVAETGEDVGLTVSAFSSLSLDPAMVVLSVDNTSQSLPYLTVGGPIGVSVLSEGQGGVAYQFSRRGIDRFEGVGIHRRTHGVATIDGVAAWFAGTIAGAFPGGDHTILTVLVEDCGTLEEARPLLYQRGQVHDWVI